MATYLTRRSLALSQIHYNQNKSRLLSKYPTIDDCIYRLPVLLILMDEVIDLRPIPADMRRSNAVRSHPLPIRPQSIDIQRIERRICCAQNALPDEVEAMLRMAVRTTPHDRLADHIETMELVEHGNCVRLFRGSQVNDAIVRSN